MSSRNSRILVHLPPEKGRSYPVVIEPGCFRKLPEMMRSIVRSGVLFLITDARVGRLYGRPLLRRLALHGIPAVMIDFPQGENSKNPTVLALLQTALLEAGVRRDSVVVALGGGVVGDIAGFAAATVLRGIALVQVPTTLLAQIDSSVGGKVGVDHRTGKNLLGTFHQPSAVFIDPLVLRTLPESEFRNGLAEAVKIATALDAGFFRWLEHHAREVTPDHPAVVRELIARSVELKALVVRRDERDKGVRQSLNLGHTIGHALEAASGYSLRHGFAVAIGLAAEAEIAHRLGYMRSGDVRRLHRLLRALRLPTRLSRIRSRPRFFDALVLDKKGDVSGPKFTLPAGIGASALGVKVSGEVIEAVMGMRK